MSKLILLRHGESMWNRLNLFTGWVDVPLSEKGITEALNAGEQIKDTPIGIIFVSSLIRSQMTAMLAMSKHSSAKVPILLHPEGSKLAEWSKTYSENQEESIPVVQSPEINERMYGELQGLNKTETAEKFGVEQVKIWRRSYDTPPPNGESLKMTAERSIPYFKDFIVPHLMLGKNVLVSAHGNSLRSIIMHLDGLSREEVLQLEIGTGVPITYNYETGTFTKEQAINATH
ncbi:MAG: 2,3-bisphosphoglycerate-dependent phosphoglycerate mutase [Chlamydiales bacterium]|jgi:2,3-bisphosphoglycerate-dependent phosphoglycerate mutase